MEFSVDRDVLADAVAWVARALPSRPVVPVLSGLRLEAGDGRLTVSCFDYELSASARVAADVAAPGEALVPGRLLAEIIRSLPGQPARFRSEQESVSLACGSAEFSLVSLPLAEYPALPPVPPPAGVADGGDLAAASAQVVPAASRDDTLPMLTAVCLDIRGEDVTLVATDRYRMAARRLRWSPARPDGRAVALVPARTLADAARAMAPGAPVTVSFEPPGAAGDGPRPVEGVISFETAGRRLTGRLIGGEFIRWESRFPAEFGCSAEVPAASFTEAVRRVSLVADRASPVHLTFGGGRVRVEARAEGRARAAESVTASFHGGEPSIAFNPQYLLDGLVAAAAAAPARHAAGAHGAVGEGGAGAADEGAGGAAGEGGGAEGGDGGRQGGAGRAAWPGAGQDAPPAGEQAGGAGAQQWVRLQFTTPARPALITSAGGPGPLHGPDGGAGGPDGGDGEPPAFRYLVVPLRAPARS